MNCTLAAPWYRLYREFAAMFGGDSEVAVEFRTDPENMSIVLYVDSQAKAYALDAVLVPFHNFGIAEVKVIVKPSSTAKNDSDEDVDVHLYENALYENSHVSNIRTGHTPFGELTYVLFKPEVIQFYNDDLGDYYGQCSTLCQEIAKKIFKPEVNVFFCTDIAEVRDNKSFAAF